MYTVFTFCVVTNIMSKILYITVQLISLCINFTASPTVLYSCLVCHTTCVNNFHILITMITYQQIPCAIPHRKIITHVPVGLGVCALDFSIHICGYTSNRMYYYRIITLQVCGGMYFLFCMLLHRYIVRIPETRRPSTQF